MQKKDRGLRNVAWSARDDFLERVYLDFFPSFTLSLSRLLRIGVLCPL